MSVHAEREIIDRAHGAGPPRHLGTTAIEAGGPGDVIVEVQNDVVRTPDDVSKHLETDARSGRKAVLLLVNRDGQLNYVALRLGEAG